MVARALPATLLGTYLALFLMMAGVALAPASAVTPATGSAKVPTLVHVRASSALKAIRFPSGDQRSMSCTARSSVSCWISSAPAVAR